MHASVLITPTHIQLITWAFLIDPTRTNIQNILLQAWNGIGAPKEGIFLCHSCFLFSLQGRLKIRQIKIIKKIKEKNPAV